MTSSTTINGDNNNSNPPVGSGTSSSSVHAYHQNLPPHYMNDDGTCTVTKYAHRKARSIVRLVHSIQLSQDMFNVNGSGNSSNDDEEEFMDMEMDMDNEDGDGDGEEEVLEWNGTKRRNGRDTLVRNVMH